jgi:hypothetical protein
MSQEPADLANPDDVPSPPAAVQGLADPYYRQCATEVWRAAWRLRDATFRWMEWWEELRQQGDADPGLPLAHANEVRQSLQVLWHHQVNIDLVRRHSLDDVLAWLPPIPDGLLKHEDEPGWQARFRHHDGYYGKRTFPKPGEPKSTSRALRVLRGKANDLIEDLRKYPVSALELPISPKTPPPGDDENSIRQVGKGWHLHYQGEEGWYPLKGSKGLQLLANLLLAPNRSLTVADLCGDPEKKLAADARSGAELAVHQDPLEVIKKQLQDIDKEVEEIDGIAAATGWNDTLEARKAPLEKKKGDLLAYLQESAAGRQLTSALKRAYHNHATQIRTFIKELAGDMPKLAAHLNAALKLEYPDFGYYPPPDTIPWKS